MRTKLYQTFAILLVVGMLFSMVAPSAALAKPQEPQASILVAPEVLADMETNGSASYWIDFKAEADLSAAYDMGWSERGWYVYNTLSATAKESQANVAAYLTGANVEYQSYWIKNTILVKSSNLNTLNGLLNFNEIKAITPRHTFILYEPDTTAAVVDNGVKAVEPNLTHVNADDVWAMGYDGTGLVIANIDTGVRYSHQALVGQYRGNNGGTFDHNYNWFNPDDPTDDEPRDGHGHGTHTMGTMVGDDGGSNQIGIAPGAEWMACAGCPDGGCTDTALLGCAEFIAAPTDLTGANENPDMRPNAVNNSWGDCGQTYDDWYASSIDAWLAAGVYPIFSNGNSSNCGYSSPPGLNTVGNPARSGNVTGVGSSGEQNGQYANHSNWGPTDNLDTVNPVTGFEMMKPQVIAPGVSIRSSTPGSDTEYQDGWTGTSMSAPHVTGLVALIWQAAPCLVGDYATTETLMEQTAVDLTYDDGSPLTPTNFPNFATGWGEIDALAAVTAAAGMCGNSVLDGTVTDVDTTEPIPGAKVEIVAETDPANNRTVYTDANGYYSANVGADTYDLTVTKFGYQGDAASGIVVADGATVTTHFYLSELDTALVSGSVFDGGVAGLGSHGYPLYASLTFAAPGFSQTIYNDPFMGLYEIELYLGQEYNVTVTAVPGGYEPYGGTYTPDTDPDSQDYYLYVPEASCAAPGYQPDYDIFYSFESSDEGFTPGGTTSFAWGDFTSGPGEGHSGTKGIATNPAGSYNASELGWMASPVIDLTGFGTSTPVIQWYDWKDIESVSYDWARVDVTKDGGVTWTTVWGPVGGVTDTSYNQQTVVLDPTYNVANFQFRFYFKSDSSVQYEGWYVDDIGIISVPVPPPTTVWSSNFDTDNGGFVSSGANSSWAWGTPTSGPNEAYSDPNVWATNLSGYYNNSEESYITSPVIDLSGYVGLAPTISFWHWYSSESNSWDWAGVEVSNNGGATWTSVWQKFGTSVSPWTFKSLPLDATYAVSNFQFRFHFHSDSSVNSYYGWYIDDVAVTVAEPVIIAAPCVVVPGGVVAGFVFDNNTEEALVGASVVSPTVETMTFDLEGDPNQDNAGLYWAFQPTAADPEDVVFTASMDKYMDDTETVSVAADEITWMDFYLGAGILSSDPAALEVTMMMGDAPLTETLTISNLGGADAIIEIAEKDDGFVPPLSIPAFTGTLPEDTRPVSMGRAPEAAVVPALTSAGLFNDLLAGEPAFAVDAYPGENLVYIPDTTVPGTWDIVGSLAGTSFFAGDFTGGDFSTLYVISYDNNNLYEVDTTTAVYTQIGTTTPPAGQTFSGLTGTPSGELYGLTTDCSASNLVTVDPETGATTNLGALPGVGCGIDLAYNTDDDMIYIVEILTDSLYKVDPATMTTTLVGSLGVSANYAQGMDYEEETGILYWAAYTTAGELRVIDMTTGASTLVGGFPSGAEVDSFAFATGGGADVPWLSEDPVSGTVPADDDLVVDVTFDPTGAGLGQPGDYLAELKVKHNTPYPVANIPVTLHLMAPGDFGTFNGTVTGLEACDVNPMPLEGATVNFWQGGSILYTTTTLAGGYYSYSVPEGTYHIEVLMDGYVSMIAFDMPVAGGETVTVDFELRLDAPCLSVDPTSLEEWLLPDTTGDQILTLVNSGAGEAVFEIVEMAVAGIQEAVELVLDDGSRDNDIGIGGTLEFLWVNRFTPDPEAFPFNLEQVQIWFSTVGMVNVGDDIIIVVYENTTGNTDPAVGSNWLYSYPTTVQALDTWNVYDLPEAVELNGPGDVIVGAIALEVPGTSYWPASMDQTATQQRSWAGWWNASPPPNPPLLPPDASWVLIDDYFPGNWMVRGYGETAGEDIVWLSEDPISGTVAGDSEQDVTVTFDATGLVLGDYFATLRVKNPPAAAINVPVTLHVVDTITRAIWLPIIMK